MTENAQSLIDYCRENDRVCPKNWDQLWRMLPNKKRVGLGWKPPLPLILAAYYGPAILKMLRLAEHIKWAEKHGSLTRISNFLRELPEEKWLHLGEY